MIAIGDGSGGGTPRAPVYTYRTKKKNDFRVLHALATPDAPLELRYEVSMPRRTFAVTMDNALHNIQLVPGREGKNAVLMGWVDAIKKHDEVVLRVEEHMDIVGAQKAVFTEKERIYQNHSYAWRQINEDPDEYYTYLHTWKPSYWDIDDIQKHVKLHVRDDEERERILEEYARYKEVEPKYEKLIPFESLVKELQEQYAEAARELDEANARLKEMMDLEKLVASQVSEDHVVANELGKKLSDIFPMIRTGYLVSKINSIPVEDQPFETIMGLLKATPTPHALELRRYDYLRHIASGKWESFQELRAMGRFAPDPRLERLVFVEACRMGDLTAVKDKLMRGADPNFVDNTDCTGMHHAAANGHIEVLKLLLEYHADIEHRNKNLETPLLFATRRGNIPGVDWLVQNQAETNVMDRQRRSALIHAISARNLELVRLFLGRFSVVNGPDFAWGWTSLHYAASVGDVDILKLLLDKKGNKYKISKQKQTPEQVAKEHYQKNAAEYLNELVFKDPGQKILWNDEGLQVWIGAKEAASPEFATAVVDPCFVGGGAFLGLAGFTAFLILNDRGVKENSMAWIEEDDDIKSYVTTFKVSDDDKTDRSWREVLLRLTAIMDFIGSCIEENRRFLICCDKGISTSPTVLISYLLLKASFPIRTSLEHLQTIRRQVQPSVSLWRGLEQLEDSLLQRKLQRLEVRVKACQLYDLD